MGKKILTEDGLKEEFESGEIDEVIDKRRDPLYKEQIADSKEDFSRRKNEEIKKFNDNPITKEYGVKAISKKLYLTSIIILILFLGLLTANMVWKNSILGKLTEKEFGTNVNIAPDNITVIDADQTTNNNQYNETFIIYNNITIKMDELNDFLIELLNQTNGS